jgi:hypothetical protein
VLAQPSRDSTGLGLSHVRGIDVSVGWAAIERSARGLEVGAQVDFGAIRDRRVRVTADAAFLRSLRLREFVVADDATYEDVFYDLSGHVGLSLLARDPARRVVPYATVAAGVHALTSSFGSIAIDLRYNSNVFGLIGAAGLRIRTGRSRGLLLELRRVQADNVSRTSAHLGWRVGG